MNNRDDNLRVRPGRIRDGGRTSRGGTRFVSQVQRAMRKTGHTGYRFGSTSSRSGGSSFGRGRYARTARSLTHAFRRVTVKARVVRHHGSRFRSAPLAKHLRYIQRDGVCRDRNAGALFGRDGDDLSGRAFAQSCEDDRHHLRFIISPEVAHEFEDLRAFARDLMARAERDLGTRLDWISKVTKQTNQLELNASGLTMSQPCRAEPQIARSLPSRSVEPATICIVCSFMLDHEIEETDDVRPLSMDLLAKSYCRQGYSKVTDCAG